MKAFIELGAAEAARAIAGGEVTSEALIEACLAQIASRESVVRAFRELVPPDKALADARERDRTPAPLRGPLHGVPIAVKEIIDVAGLHCSLGTPIHEERVPTRDAPVVERLRAAGAVILGTTISTEYAIARAGPTTNPYDPSRSPGGSSSGSAAAVAARMVPLALGTQTVGSILRPATYCGVYGLKPTFGSITTDGVMTLSPALDHVGFLAREPDDLALASRVLFDPAADGDAHDEGSHGDGSEFVPPRQVLLIEGPLRECIDRPSHVALERATGAFEARGARVSREDLPSEFGEAEAVLDTILSRDIANAHGLDRDRAGALMSAKLRGLIDRGRNVSPLEYAGAIDRARGYRESLVRLLEGGRIILAPATDGVAPPISVEGTGSARLQGLYTLAGLPALAVQCGMFDGLPIGVQLVAAPGHEALLIAAARSIRGEP